MFKTLIVILMTSVLVNNYVLNRFLDTPRKGQIPKKRFNT